MNNDDNTASEDFRMRFPVLIDDIKYIKTRQWTVTYYLLLLYGAIISFYVLLDSGSSKISNLQKSFLIIIALLIGVFGIIYQLKFHSRLIEYRRLLDKMLDGNYFSKEYIDFEKYALKKRKRKNNGEISWINDFWLYTFPFILMLLTGIVFVFWFIL
jgi:hypothetical protein